MEEISNTFGNEGHDPRILDRSAEIRRRERYPRRLSLVGTRKLGGKRSLRWKSKCHFFETRIFFYDKFHLVSKNLFVSNQDVYQIMERKEETLVEVREAVEFC